MAEGVKMRRRTLCQGAAISVAAALGYPGSAFAQATKPAPPKLEKVQKTHAESLLGQPVEDAKRQTIGHIVDVLIDTAGNPHAAVIEFTGFLGVGNRKVAVAWRALHFALEGERIVISVAMDVSALRAMPEYDTSAKSVPVAMPAHPAPRTAKSP